MLAQLDTEGTRRFHCWVEKVPAFKLLESTRGCPPFPLLGREDTRVSTAGWGRYRLLGTG